MKKQKLTFESLNELLDEKFKIHNQILIAAFDKDYKHLEGLIYSLDNKVEDFRTEVNMRFGAVDKRFDKVEPTRFVAP